jgi:GntR family transcriptional regulator, transcriptional repressor for pyruvate dehydrogenase complex
MSVTSHAISQIKQLIMSGEISPGEKLPKESELAMKLGVSRSSLREAVRALTALGVLDARQGDGTYVTSLEPYLLLQGTRFVVELLEKETLLELLMVRRLLEPGATALAAARISDSDLSRLRECLRRMDSASTQEELVEADDEFHSIIVNASGRPTLAALVKSFSSRPFRARIWRGLSDEVAVEQSRRAHYSIYRAIEWRDPELAHAAAPQHIAEVESWFESKFERSGSVAEMNGGAA